MFLMLLRDEWFKYQILILQTHISQKYILFNYKLSQDIKLINCICKDASY